jgi:hypothetical protein
MKATGPICEEVTRNIQYPLSKPNPTSEIKSLRSERKKKREKKNSIVRFDPNSFGDY